MTHYLPFDPAILPAQIQSDTRALQICHWLNQLADESLNFRTFELASADASFRRYFRIKNRRGLSFVIMDAPPEQYSLKPFIDIRQLFKTSGVHVPAIYHVSHEAGFMQLEDLGLTTYAEQLSSDTADSLYTKACESLIALQLISQPNVLPDYDQAILLNEMRLFDEWYLQSYRQKTLTQEEKNTLNQQYELICDHVLRQARVFVHRDYHSRNLMVCQENTPGIIDFQDALYGPITYDIVSLWRDAYIHWDEERQINWVIRYWEKARQVQLPVPEDFGEFYRDFEWMGLQRHLKILGIFARLSLRDGKHGYLKDLPLVERYVFQVIHRYNDLKPLAQSFHPSRRIPSNIYHSQFMKAMILAAGRGERMRPLTDASPKPMLTINDKPLIVWHIEALKAAGFKEIVINHAWLGDVIEQGLGNGSKWGVNIQYSPEMQALGTAGGIATALPLLTNEHKNQQPFFVVNGDVFCPDFQYDQVAEKSKLLSALKQKAYLYLVRNPDHNPLGDFCLVGQNVLSEVATDEPRYTFAGIAIYHPDLFKDCQAQVKAPLAPLLRQAVEEKQVIGELLDCSWTDVGTPERLAQLNKLYQSV